MTDEDLLCAAVLHDVLEETGADPTAIELEFGSRVRSLVEELTRTEPSADRVDGMTKDEVWQLRADMLLEEVSKMSAEAQIVKLADRLANLSDAHRTKRGEKLARYERQSKRILAVVPRVRNEALWDAINVLIA